MLQYHMANTNKYPGLARGPIDHKASSVINCISNKVEDMGNHVLLFTPPSAEILPRVESSTNEVSTKFYGVVVGGDVDGVYGDGSPSVDDSTRASNGAGQGLVVCTQGRCLAKVNGSDNGAIVIGDLLGPGDFVGQLSKAVAGRVVMGVALQPVSDSDIDIIAVDIQRGGILPA